MDAVARILMSTFPSRGYTKSRNDIRERAGRANRFLRNFHRRWPGSPRVIEILRGNFCTPEDASRRRSVSYTENYSLIFSRALTRASKLSARNISRELRKTRLRSQGCIHEGHPSTTCFRLKALYKFPARSPRISTKIKFHSATMGNTERHCWLFRCRLRVSLRYRVSVCLGFLSYPAGYEIDSTSNIPG